MMVNIQGIVVGLSSSPLSPEIIDWRLCLWVPQDPVDEKKTSTPIGSMYGIYANIWGILMVNVTIYSIHGSYGTKHYHFGGHPF